MSRLNDLIDLKMIEHALQGTGKAAIRRCNLTAEHVVWRVIGLALFRNMTILHVGASACLTPGNVPLELLKRQPTRAWVSRISAPTATCKVRLLAVDGVVWDRRYTRQSRQTRQLCEPER